MVILLSEEEKKFEEAIKELETLVEEMESGGLSLEESLDKFSKGVELIKLCHNKLNNAEKKIEQILKDKEEIVPFEMEDDE